MSIRSGDKIFVAPSGVQKERIESDELFVLNADGLTIEEPDACKSLKKSECTPLVGEASVLTVTITAFCVPVPEFVRDARRRSRHSLACHICCDGDPDFKGQ